MFSMYVFNLLLLDCEFIFYLLSIGSKNAYGLLIL